MLWYDGGHNQQLGDSAAYHQLGCNIALPTVNIANIAKIPNYLVEDSKIVEICTKVKFSAMR
jgi:hypothetical protein